MVERKRPGDRDREIGRVVVVVVVAVVIFYFLFVTELPLVPIACSSFVKGALRAD